MIPQTRRPNEATYQKALYILSETLRPWRAAALFRASFVPVAGHEQPVGRESERFREHFVEYSHEVKKYGPWYALTRWIDPVLPMICPDSLVQIPLSGEAIRQAQSETLHRLPYMVVRNPNANPVTRKMAALNGLTVEQHVKKFFSSTWPESYLPASNERMWRKPAPDDFSLILNGRRFTVDVAKSDQKSPARWRIHPGKLCKSDIRIVAYYNERAVVMQGYASGRSDDFDLRPIERLIVRLNIQKDPSAHEVFRDLLLS